MPATRQGPKVTQPPLQARVRPWQVHRAVPTDPTADQIALLVQRLTEFGEKMRALQGEYGERRRQLIAESGLPPELVEKVIWSEFQVPGFPRPVASDTSDQMALTSGEDYAQNERMSSNEIASSPRKRGRPLESSGPIAAWARSMGLSMDQVAALLAENVNSVRTWDRRVAEGKGKTRLPADVEAKFRKLTKGFRKVDE